MTKEVAAPAVALPGLKPVLELIAKNPLRLRRVFLNPDTHGSARVRDACSKHGIPLEEAESSALDHMSQGTAHQGVVGLLKPASPLSFLQLLDTVNSAPLPLILALDQVQDPRNLGAVARTAWALGCAGLLLPKHNSAAIGGAAFKTSAGALALLPFCQVTNLARSLDQAEEAGLAIYGTICSKDDSEDAFSISWQFPCVLVLGNEEKGIRSGVLKRCQYKITIPFARNFDSLNIAQSGAILLGLCAAQNSLRKVL